MSLALPIGSSDEIAVPAWPARDECRLPAERELHRALEERQEQLGGEMLSWSEVVATARRLAGR